MVQSLKIVYQIYKKTENKVHQSRREEILAKLVLSEIENDKILDIHALATVPEYHLVLPNNDIQIGFCGQKHCRPG